MTESYHDHVRSLLSGLQEERISAINAFIGFDACIDKITGVVKGKTLKGARDFYTSSRQFGEFLIRHENKSCGIELYTRHEKIGGNMVITGNALGNLGIKSDCIGTFGFPEILPVFRTISGFCSLYSVGETISTTALEFNDAKVMMFDPGYYNTLDWESIKNILGIERLRKLFSGKQLVMLLNWSEIENSSGIWKGIIEEILPFSISGDTKPIFFTDFSDCSRKSKEEINIAIGLLGNFRKYFKVIFSMNQNEAEIISAALNLKPGNSDEGLIRGLYNCCMSDEIVIHRSKDALAFDGVIFEKCDTFFCREPAILTGGGDNFNAGYCLSKFYNFNLFQSLIIANAVAGFYVKSGYSPDMDELVEFLSMV